MTRAVNPRKHSRTQNAPPKRGAILAPAPELVEGRPIDQLTPDERALVLANVACFSEYVRKRATHEPTR